MALQLSAVPRDRGFLTQVLGLRNEQSFLGFFLFPLVFAGQSVKTWILKF